MICTNNTIQVKSVNDIIFDELITKYRSVYICGKSGCGKTSSIKQYLNYFDYDYTLLSIQDIKKEADIWEKVQGNNIMRMFKNASATSCNNIGVPNSYGNHKNKKVLIIDNIDYVNLQDKKWITYIIKVIKGNESKKLPISCCIIFIGTNKTERKVRELMEHVDTIIHITSSSNMIPFYTLSLDEDDMVNKETRHCMKTLFEHTYDKSKTPQVEKTVIGLCFHENMKIIENMTSQTYMKILDNICSGDYYDRVAFQRQLWQFNDMTFNLKVLANYDVLRYDNIKQNVDVQQLEFTKVLTKYSNEYSNMNFVISLCMKTQWSKEKLFYIVQHEPIMLKSKLSMNELKRLRKIVCVNVSKL
jgi:GTPase SAR1 family protein